MYLKCYFCETNDALGICVKCGRGLCKEHGKVTSEGGAMSGKLYYYLCQECIAGAKKGMELGTI